MQCRPLGKTGLSVSILGLGAVQIGKGTAMDADVERLLSAALDAGINLIDTARSYDRSEERIGRCIAHRRDEFILSSKCGYNVAGTEDWTGPCVAGGIDDALRRLGTDHLDIMHLHSCDRAVLERGDVIDALEDARAAGKVRFIAYSGENDDLRFAIDCGRFDTLQTSVNVCDQRGLDSLIPDAVQHGLGVIAKRPLANAFWRFAKRPAGDYCEEYWSRARQMGLVPPVGMAWDEFALRFAAFVPGVATVIAGTANLAHLRTNIQIIDRGPLPADESDACRSTFRLAQADWKGQV